MDNSVDDTYSVYALTNRNIWLECDTYGIDVEKDLSFLINVHYHSCDIFCIFLSYAP